MTWTYDLTILGTSELMQVRQEIGDTDEADQLLQDEEILRSISVESNFWGAAARCCEQISRTLIRKADVRLGRVLMIQYAKMSEQYLQMACRLRAKSLGTTVPWVGGMKVADKELYDQDSTLVQPTFARRMMIDPYTGGESSDTDDNSSADLPFGAQP